MYNIISKTNDGNPGLAWECVQQLSRDVYVTVNAPVWQRHHLLHRDVVVQVDVHPVEVLEQISVPDVGDVWPRHLPETSC